jgi:hypothetical protein
VEAKESKSMNNLREIKLDAYEYQVRRMRNPTNHASIHTSHHSLSYQLLGSSEISSALMLRLSVFHGMVYDN